jgi:hypothetical protein
VVRCPGFLSCCLSFLKCFRILCRLVCPLNVQKGTVFPQSQVISLPSFRSMYRLSPLEYRELEKQVTKFLKDGILEVSQSPYGAPVLFVPKPNGQGLRLCIDYRAFQTLLPSKIVVRFLVLTIYQTQWREVLSSRCWI